MVRPVYWTWGVLHRNIIFLTNSYISSMLGPIAGTLPRMEKIPASITCSTNTQKVSPFFRFQVSWVYQRRPLERPAERQHQLGRHGHSQRRRRGEVAAALGGRQEPGRLLEEDPGHPAGHPPQLRQDDWISGNVLLYKKVTSWLLRCHGIKLLPPRLLD